MRSATHARILACPFGPLEQSPRHSSYHPAFPKILWVGPRSARTRPEPSSKKVPPGPLSGSPFTFGPQATPLMLCTKMLLTILPFDEVAARSQ